jgi:hypothetical protein
MEKPIDEGARGAADQILCEYIAFLSMQKLGTDTVQYYAQFLKSREPVISMLEFLEDRALDDQDVKCYRQALTKSLKNVLGREDYNLMVIELLIRKVSSSPLPFQGSIAETLIKLAQNDLSKDVMSLFGEMGHISEHELVMELVRRLVLTGHTVVVPFILAKVDRLHTTPAVKEEMDCLDRFLKLTEGLTDYHKTRSSLDIAARPAGVLISQDSAKEHALREAVLTRKARLGALFSELFTEEWSVLEALSRVSPIYDEIRRVWEGPLMQLRSELVN